MKLKELAKEFGCQYIDITEETIDRESGVLRDDFIELSKIDCHQSAKKTAFLWAKKLKGIL